MTSPQVLWVPTQEQVEATQMEQFRLAFSSATGIAIKDSLELHRVSVEHREAFWSFALQWLKIHGSIGKQAFDQGSGAMADASFFPDLSLSFTEQLVEAPDSDPLELAIIEIAEDGGERSLTRAQLIRLVAEASAALRGLGIVQGDVVAAYMPNVAETVIMMLATLNLGGIFTSASSEFGALGVIERFSQVEPKLLLAASHYHYGGKTIDRKKEIQEIAQGLSSLQQVLVVGDSGAYADSGPPYVAWDDFLAPHEGAPVLYSRFAFNQAGFVLYSSGTTGKPKAIVHRLGGLLLKHRVEHALHCDIRPGDRVAYFTTCGWMMWNWLVSALASSATIVLYDGKPFFPEPTRLFDLVDQHRLTLLGVSPRYLAELRQAGVHPAKSHDLGSLRTLCSTGSPLSPEAYAYVYGSIKVDLHLASISGGTDLCGCLVAGDPTRPVLAGEIQVPALGLDVDVVNAEGISLSESQGELVCRNPFPSMPLGFIGDDDGSRYREAYFSSIPGMWVQGDFATRTASGGFVIHGRSDATLNASGVRIGTAEIYRVLEGLEGVVDALAAGKEVPGDTEIWLFVVLGPARKLDDEMHAAIVASIRSQLSPRHVPAKIFAVSAIPRTRSAKLAELAVTDIINGRPLRSVEGLENPGVLEEYRSLS
ncbi:MAG: acetoacetate--CoA ligase [Actinomycetes bacterium]